ncbi:MAG TPA: hypothetical protein DCX54_07275 [Flavobacteriales bacterium]|nr:hypothetical protein [Flavobacteriales bacterium]
MIIVVALSLSLLVVLASLALLAKTKKEELPKGYVFASYATLSLGILMFLGSIMGGIVKSCHHRGQNSCHMSQAAGNCGHMAECSKGAMGGAHMGSDCQHKSCKSSCTMGGHGHGNWQEGGMHKKMCIKKGGVTKEIKIDVDLDDEDGEVEEGQE